MRILVDRWQLDGCLDGGYRRPSLAPSRSRSSTAFRPSALRPPHPDLSNFFLNFAPRGPDGLGCPGRPLARLQVHGCRRRSCVLLLGPGSSSDRSLLRPRPRTAQPTCCRLQIAGGWIGRRRLGYPGIAQWDILVAQGPECAAGPAARALTS
jgi:hypothetical protein